jgi:phosphoribosylpyrophosphate synthetase
LAADTNKIARAEEAGRIFKAAIFNESWEELRKTLIEKLINTDPLDKEIRELHYSRIKLLDELKEALIRIMNEGSIEAKSLRLKRK